jgi:predicted  nucleic acid-binding Zn-ribbon protein
VDPTLKQLLTEIYQRHREIDALRERVAELEAQLDAVRRAANLSIVEPECQDTEKEA